MTASFVILSSPPKADHIVNVIRREGGIGLIEVVSTSAELQRAVAAISGKAILISFANSVIVPHQILARFDVAVNFHAASPEYPGRDPHHFAHYDRVKRYGATAHLMTTKVDDGPILAVEYEEVPAGARPADLLAMAEAAARRLIENLAPRLVRGEPLKPVDVAWSSKKRARADFLSLCRVPSYASKAEVERRSASTEFGSYRNLFIDLNGFRFRLEGRIPEAEREQNEAKWGAFTERAYEDLLHLFRSRLSFAIFEDAPERGQVLWCHHVGMSVHRAKRLAEIEYERGLRSTFFLNPRSRFYDLREAAVLQHAQTIVSLGHRIGLLFDGECDGPWDAKPQLMEALAADREMLKRLLETDIDVVAFGVQSQPRLELSLMGMLNASNVKYHEQYKVVSEHGGRWQFGSIPDLLRGDLRQPLHVIIHPEWWTPEAMSPKERVERCVLGRAAFAMRLYETEPASG